MEKVRGVIKGVRTRIHQISAYIATLYYLEIVFLMFGLLFLYGKAVSIIAGILLTLALTYHVIQLFLKNRLHRKLQLWLMDFHAAFSAGFLFFNAVQGVDMAPGALIVLITRTLHLACELPLIFYLSGDGGISAFR
ncbi:MAG TPA: hypothetical protein PKN50_00405 [Spirochaetota bacterium]|nr:hypothetical protein [Spirochaetota bacterium]HPV40058.1 hypothetical protein [Spirochaetota bacterium]